MPPGVLSENPLVILMKPESTQVIHRPDLPSKAIVVDEDEHARRHIVSCLQFCRIEVQSLNCGEAALEAWVNMQPKPMLLITELKTGKLGGVDLAIVLRKLDPA